MTIKAIVCVIVCIFTKVESSCNANGDNTDAYYPALDWSDPFDWQLIKAFGSIDDGRNVLISPISLKLVLALLYEGASGATEKEFQTVLNFHPQKRVNSQQIQTIIQDLRENGKCDAIVQFANAIFLDSTIEPLQSYAATVRHFYDTGIVSTNFSQHVEAANVINSWIRTATSGKVTHLVNSDEVVNAILILTNALYFKGLWQKPFEKTNTVPGTFFKSPTETIQTEYMATTDSFYYVESPRLDAKILRLPYKGGQFSMFFILPRTETALQETINRLDLTNLRQDLRLMDQQNVRVILPKFKYSDQNSFTQFLRDLGLRQMFQNTASFPGIARGTYYRTLRRLVVSDVIQKTGIEVNEEGAEAYAATDVQVGNKNKEPNIVFNASHPFLFFVEDQRSGSILFIGKVSDPRKIDDVPTRLAEIPSVRPIDDGTQHLNLQPTFENSVVGSKRFNYFDLELLRELGESNENVFVSPASLKVTLAMLHEGAGGKTAEEIRNALRLESPNFREQLQKILDNLGDESGSTTVKSANALFASNSLGVKSDYRTKLNELYKVAVNSVDFSNGATTGVINGWVNNATKGLISEIVPPDALFADKSLLLLNALYFKGKWRRMFSEKYTSRKCFRALPGGKCTQVPMMQVVDTFNYNYVPYLDSQAIVLPYDDGKYAMLVLLPSESSNVNMLTRDLQHDRITSILSQLQPTEVAVELPRFEIEFETDVVDYLKQLRINELFSPKANLSGIAESADVKVSSILHKAKIEVNEKGTVAAAATGAVVIPLMGSAMPRMSMNRPFVFFIYHVATENIIFEGGLFRPKEEPQQQQQQQQRLLPVH